MVQLACVIGYIAAPASLIWEVLADFGHPQLLAKSIESCELYGEGVGAIRVVTARGMTIHERLVEADRGAMRLRYRALDTADMPFSGVKSYLATVTLRPFGENLTRIQWSGDGDIDGSPEDVDAHFCALYTAAIANLKGVAEVGRQRPEGRSN